MTKLISTQTFAEIKERGTGVPRDTEGYTLTRLAVGKTYDFRNEIGQTFKGKVTQNCPIHIVIVP